MRRFPALPLFATLVLGVLLEPLGHQAAYVLRYGVGGAWRMESHGSHLGFLGTFSITAWSVLIAGGLTVLGMAAIRLILGRRQVHVIGSTRTFALLAITQSAFFIVKEIFEALSAQGTPDLLAIVVLAVMAQLPLAAVAAWMIGWARGYLELAPEAIRAVLAVRISADPGPCDLPLATCAVPSVRFVGGRWYRRRGPPPLHLT